MVVPDKGKRRTHAGFSALVRAMQGRGQVAIVRYLSRDAISLCAASPLLGGDGGPDALVGRLILSNPKNPDCTPCVTQCNITSRHGSCVMTRSLPDGGRPVAVTDRSKPTCQVIPRLEEQAAWPTMCVILTALSCDDHRRWRTCPSKRTCGRTSSRPSARRSGRR